MAEILDARVKQKTGTASEFAGFVLLEGEEARVRLTPNGPVWNTKTGPGLFDDLPYDIQLTGVPQVVEPGFTPPAGVPMLFLPKESGIYQGINVDITEGVVYLPWDGSTLTDVVYPINLAGYATTGQVNAVSQSVSIVSSEVDSILSKSINIIDRQRAKNQAWNTSGGVGSTAANWVRVDLMPIKPNTTYHYQGNGSIANGVPLAVFFDATGNHLPAENLLSTGGSGQNKDFTTGANTAFIGVNVANRTGAGNDPVNATEMGTIMVSEGAGNKPYQPYIISIDGSKITGSIATPQIQGIEQAIVEVDEKVDSFTVPSKNMFNRAAVLPGTYNTSGVPDSSVNWLRTPYIPVQPSTTYTISGFAAISGSNARILFYDAGGAFISSIMSVGGSTSPVTFTTPSNCASVGINILNRVGAGSNPQAQPEMGTFQLELGGSATSYQPYGVLVDGNKIANVPGDFRQQVIVVREGSTVLRVYFHGGNDAADDIYFRVRFVRQNSPAKFILLWRMDEADLCRRTGATSFDVIERIVDQGVWENAIYTTTGGYDDALGSAHGWEMMEDVTFMVDNQVIDVTTPGSSWVGKEFSVMQSTLLKTFDGSGNVGRMAKRWSFHPGRIEVGVKIHWLSTLGIDIGSFIGMLPVLRKNDDDFQVTTTGMSDEEYVKYDISESGFTNPLYSNNSDAARSALIAWGDRAYFAMAVKRKQEFANCGMYIQNTAAYNKFYNRLGSTTVDDGDKWEVDVFYDIRVK